MTTKKSTRYDFGRCSLEFVDGAPFGPDSLAVRLSQVSGGDEVLFTLSRGDAASLAFGWAPMSMEPGAHEIG